MPFLTMAKRTSTYRFHLVSVQTIASVITNILLANLVASFPATGISKLEKMQTFGLAQKTLFTYLLINNSFIVQELVWKFIQIGNSSPRNVELYFYMKYTCLNVPSCVSRQDKDTV